VPANDEVGGNRVRLVDAALACVARHGTKKTTVDDVAREAGVSRATLYRAFPGGKEAVLRAAAETEVARFYSTLAVSMGRAADLEEVLVSAITVSAVYLSNHATLHYLLEHEPDVVLNHLLFGQMDETLRNASSFAQPFFVRWLEPEHAARAAELVVRLLVSYLLQPSARLHLEDEAEVTAFIRRFILPGMLHPSRPSPNPSRSVTT
jgi:AcrR family transcriptional regulator